MQLPRPSAEEFEVIKKWIVAGAQEFPKPERRDPFLLNLNSSLGNIHRHITNASRDDLGNLRYFTLAHLYTDPTVETN